VYINKVTRLDVFRSKVAKMHLVKPVKGMVNSGARRFFLCMSKDRHPDVILET
jgi:hypothetical protein